MARMRAVQVSNQLPILFVELWRSMSDCMRCFYQLWQPKLDSHPPFTLWQRNLVIDRPDSAPLICVLTVSEIF